MERLEAHRLIFASLITANAGIPNTEGRIAAAFGATPREKFLGPGPWKAFTAAGYIDIPSCDPALLYQDIVVALQPESRINTKINNGQPTLHAASLNALGVKAGETVIHVGAGTGYYTAILAHLVGPTGAVHAYEIDRELADRARENLADCDNVTVHPRSGAEGPLPECDALYVNAGATDPLDVWLDALRPGGRLLFPLTPAAGFGAMLLVTRRADGCPDEALSARFIVGAMFIGCTGARDDETAARLTEVFQRGDFRKVRALHRGSAPDETSWFAGRGWWLSTAELTSEPAGQPV